MTIPAWRDINLLGVEEKTAIGLSGEICASYELTPNKDLRMCATSDHQGFVASFSRMLEGLPTGFGVLLEAEVFAAKNNRQAGKPSTSIPATNPVVEAINKERGNLFADKERRIDFFAHLWSSQLNPLRLPFLPPLIPQKKNAVKSSKPASDGAAVLEDVARSFESSLHSIDVQTKRFSSDRIADRYWSLLSPMKAGLMPAKFSKDFSLRSQLASSNSREEAEYVFLDGMYHSAITFYNYPDELELGAVDALLDILPPGSRYVQGILVPDQESFLDSLKSQHRKAGGLAGEAKNKDFESEARLNDIDAIITQCRVGGERIYVVWAGVILRNESLPALLESRKRMLHAIREIFGATAINEDYLHRRTLLASLPMGAHLSPRRNLMMGSTASALAPLSHPWRGTKEGMLLSSESNRSLRFDLFDGGSPKHGIIFAKTGSGKSFSAVMLVLSFLEDQRYRAMIIDRGHSYRRACEILKGTYIDIKLDEKFAMNPLASRKALTKSDGTLDSESLGAQSSLILQIAKVTSNTARFVMDEAMKRLYENTEDPLLSDLAKVLKTTKWDTRVKTAAEELVGELLPFTDGIYSVLFSRPSGVRAFETQLTVFELSGLNEHPLLQSVLGPMIQFSVARQLEKKSVRKIILIDEAWKFFKELNTSDLIGSYYREMRKYNGAVVSISQSPKDFLATPELKSAITTNIDWKMVLKMAESHETLTEFQFSDQAIERSKTLQKVDRAFSEVLVKFGEAPARVARIAPTSIQYWIATTNADEVVAEQSFREKNNLSPFESVQAMAEKVPVVSW